MLIDTKLNVGDPLYHLRLKPMFKKVNCSFCGGSGTIIGLDFNGCRHDIDCPLCHGQGSSTEYRYIVERLEVTSIHIELDEDNEVCISYECENDVCSTYGLGESSYTFITQKEAQAYADELNKKENLG